MRKIFDVNKTRRCTAYLNSIIILKYINHTNWAVTYTYILLKLILYVFNWQFSYNPKLNYSVWVIINTITSRFWQDLNDFECVWGIIRISVLYFRICSEIFWSPIKCFLSFEFWHHQDYVKILQGFKQKKIKRKKKGKDPARLQSWYCRFPQAVVVLVLRCKSGLLLAIKSLKSHFPQDGTDV